MRNSDREFRWISSTDGDAAELEALNTKMTEFYSSIPVRKEYEEMCERAQHTQPAVLHALIQSIVEMGRGVILEVGCGSGWIFQQLLEYGVSPTQYTGLEISDIQVEENIAAFPEAGWVRGSAYEMPFNDNSFSVVYSYFVLEHCVYPARALDEMLRVVRVGGVALIVCPDFAGLGVLPSQALGPSNGSAKAHLKRGQLVSALVRLFDSRWRLPRALRRARVHAGRFLVNAKPVCLRAHFALTPDVDAVYIATKEDIETWADKASHCADFPAGKVGQFGRTTFVRIRKMH